MKKLVTAGVLGLATISVTQTAKADEVKQASVDNVRSSQNSVDPIQKAKNDVEQAPKAVNEQQNMVNQAQNDTDQAKYAVEQKQNLVTEKTATQVQTEKAEKNAKTELDKAQKVADETTPEKIRETQKKANDIEQQIGEQQKNVAVAEKEYENTKLETDKVQNVQTSVENAVSDTQNEVDRAQGIVDNSDAGKIQEKIDTAQTNLDNAKQNKSDIENQISDKEQTIKNSQAEADGYQNDRNKAKQEKEDSFGRYQQGLSNDVAIAEGVEKQKEKVNELAKDVNSLEQQIKDVVVYPTVPKKAMDALVAHKPYEGMAKDLHYDSGYVDPKTYIINKDFLYKGPEADKQRKVDVLHLTDEQNKELNIFAAEIVNQIRAQAGVAPVKISQGSMDYAKEMATKTSVKETHDHKLIQKMGDDHNVSAWENLSLNYKVPERVLGPSISMYNVKKDIFGHLVSQVFADEHSNYGHAYAIISSHPEMDEFNDPNNVYFGVAYDRFGNTHFEYINPILFYEGNLAQYNTTQDQFDTQNLVAIPDKAAKIKAYNDKKDELSKAQADLKDRQNTLEQSKKATKMAEQDFAVAKGHVSIAQTKLDNTKKRIENLKSELASLKNSLSDASDKVNMAQVSLEHAQGMMDNFNTELRAKLTNLQLAKDKLKKLNDQLDSVRAQLSNIQAKEDNQKSLLENEINKLSELKAKLSEVENLIEDMQNAEPNLKNAKSKYDLAHFENLDAQIALENAKKNLSTAQATHATTVEQLSSEYAKLGKLQYELLATKSNFDKLINLKNEEEKQRLEQEKELARLESQFKIQDKGYTIFNGIVVDKNGQQVVGWTVKGNKIIDMAGNEFMVSKNIATNSTPSTPEITSVRESADHSLPQLGEKNQLSLLGLGIALLFGGAFGFRKKTRNGRA